MSLSRLTFPRQRLVRSDITWDFSVVGSVCRERLGEITLDWVSSVASSIPHTPSDNTGDVGHQQCWSILQMKMDLLQTSHISVSWTLIKGDDVYVLNRKKRDFSLCEVRKKTKCQLTLNENIFNCKSLDCPHTSIVLLWKSSSLFWNSHLYRNSIKVKTIF